MGDGYMDKLPRDPNHKKLFPFFLLAVSVIVAYQVITNLDTVLGWLQTFLSILQPFFAGFIIAYILNIPCQLLTRLFQKSRNRAVRRLAKAFSIGIIYAVVLFLIVIILSKAVPALSKSIGNFIINAEVYQRNMNDFVGRLSQQLNLDINLDSLFKTLSVENIVDFLTLENIQTSINAVMGVSSGILNAALALISSIYFLLEAESFCKFAMRLLGIFIPPKPLGLFMKYVRNVNSYFKTFLRCQIIDACIIGTVASVGLWIIGSQYFQILGPMIGIFNLIPYFGSIIASLLAVVIIAFTEGMMPAVITAIFLIIMQQLDGNLLQPRLLGGSLSLSPLLIIIGITVGGAFWGVLGMIIAVPIITVLKNILDDFISYQEKSKNKKRRPVE